MPVTRLRRPTRRPAAQHASKPPYRVPTMEEVRALPWNGYTAVSTFSGCGGNATGYRMAGFRMAWANEFVPAAQDTYRANAAPGTVLDTRDVREITGAELLAAAGLRHGEIDLFDGSPPCASFSTAGKKEDGWGITRKYSDTAQRSDDLFYEYARLVGETQPRTFVAENVSGLVKGTSKGYFKLILAALKEKGYRVEARLLDASWLGVPQARQRLIFIGVREDLGLDPVFPAPLPYQYAVRDALPWVIRQARGSSAFGPDSGSMVPADLPSTTFGASPNTGNGYWPPSMVETRLIHDTSGEFGSGDVTDRPCPTITSGVNGLNSRHFQIHGGAAPVTDAAGRPIDPETQAHIGIGPKAHMGEIPDGLVRRRLTLRELRALSGFPPDFILTGTYLQRWERIGRAVPPVMMRHIATAVRDGVLNPARERGLIPEKGSAP